MGYQTNWSPNERYREYTRIGSTPTRQPRTQRQPETPRQSATPRQDRRQNHQRQDTQRRQTDGEGARRAWAETPTVTATQAVTPNVRGVYNSPREDAQIIATITTNPLQSTREEDDEEDNEENWIGLGQQVSQVSHTVTNAENASLASAFAINIAEDTKLLDIPFNKLGTLLGIS